MRFLFLSLLLIPTVSLAHGEAPALEAEVGEYLIDIGYAPAPPAANQNVTFDLDLYNIGPPIDYADFASVIMRISMDGKELDSSTVENDGVNVPTLTVKFPVAGGYDLDVRYHNERNELIVARTFYLEVVGPARAFIGQGIIGVHYIAATVLIVGSSVAVYMSRRKKFAQAGK